jgi:hypothetical protein
MSDPFASDLPSIPRVPRKSGGTAKTAPPRTKPPAKAKPVAKPKPASKPKTLAVGMPKAKAVGKTKLKAKVPVRKSTVLPTKHSRKKPIADEDDDIDDSDDEDADDDESIEKDCDESVSGDDVEDMVEDDANDVDVGEVHDDDVEPEEKPVSSRGRPKSRRTIKPTRKVAFQDRDDDDEDVEDDSSASKEKSDDDEDDAMDVVVGADTVSRAAVAKVYDEYSEDDGDLLDSDEDDDAGPGVGDAGARLTVRQRALQGEDVDVSLAKLASPAKLNMKAPLLDDDITNDESKEMRKQQKVRLRNMIHEKRNKEKRAAMVDKVLRGVTSKRKKLSLANEAYNAEVDSRLTRNEARKGCYRYTSKVGGAFLSIPEGADPPSSLAGGRQVSSYPPKCDRDPRTGKRILISTPSVSASS